MDVYGIKLACPKQPSPHSFPHNSRLSTMQTCQPAGTENLEILKKGGPKTWRSQKKTWRFI